MKKYSLIAIILALLLSVSGCEKPEGPSDSSFKQYFPAAIGNYWVYEVVTKDTSNYNGVNHFDSLVVTSVSSNARNPIYELTFYRDGSLYGVINVDLNSSAFIITSTKAFYPFMPLDTESCWSLSKEWQIAIAVLNNNKRLYDSTPAEPFPSIIVDSSGQEMMVESETVRIWDCILTKEGSHLINIGDSHYSAEGYQITGERILKLISPPNSYLRELPNIKCKYYDNYRALVLNDFSIDINFSKGIGIVETSGYINRCDKLFHSHTRKLVRYKIN